ncbi:uncharacterized protein B0H18DRAFT_1128739 [Fomitopsis serialis]|uniref:uncharacterized protein n=1 Tax=Fomitopsis serialis TaxID=139415 RepID=UPI00200812FE|nr:uncharacterized protein B0H18DRAFT_1128739 [Neoantrodia serialis]KAH9911401.1 hypothetical protein B0H18DRAFT_1128739 [Neoantrodia serialis]
MGPGKPFVVAIRVQARLDNTFVAEKIDEAVEPGGEDDARTKRAAHHPIPPFPSARYHGPRSLPPPTVNWYQRPPPIVFTDTKNSLPRRPRTGDSQSPQRVAKLKAEGKIYPDVAIWNGKDQQWVEDLETWDSTEHDVAASLVDWVERRQAAKKKGTLADPPQLGNKGEGEIEVESERELKRAASGPQKRSPAKNSPQAVEEASSPNVADSEDEVVPETEEEAVDAEEEMEDEDVEMVEARVEEPIQAHAPLPAPRKVSVLSERAAGKKPAQIQKRFRELDEASVISISDDEGRSPPFSESESPSPPTRWPSPHLPSRSASPMPASPLRTSGPPITLAERKARVDAEITGMRNIVTDHRGPCSKTFGIMSGLWSGVFADQAHVVFQAVEEVKAMKLEVEELKAMGGSSNGAVLRELRQLRNEFRTTADRLDGVEARLADLSASRESMEKRLKAAEELKTWGEMTVKAVRHGMDESIRRIEDMHTGLAFKLLQGKPEQPEPKPAPVPYPGVMPRWAVPPMQSPGDDGNAAPPLPRRRAPIASPAHGANDEEVHPVRLAKDAALRTRTPARPVVRPALLAGLTGYGSDQPSERQDSSPFLRPTSSTIEKTDGLEAIVEEPTALPTAEAQPVGQETNIVASGAGEKAEEASTKVGASEEMEQDIQVDATPKHAPEHAIEAASGPCGGEAGPSSHEAGPSGGEACDRAKGEADECGVKAMDISE